MNAVMRTEVRGVAHEPAAPALELKDVAVSYNARTNGALAGPDGQSTDDDKLALANISFTVKVGEPLYFEKTGPDHSLPARRQVTDRIMDAIAELSGQERSMSYNQSKAAE